MEKPRDGFLNVCLVMSYITLIMLKANHTNKPDVGGVGEYTLLVGGAIFIPHRKRRDAERS